MKKQFLFSLLALSMAYVDQEGDLVISIVHHRDGYMGAAVQQAGSITNRCRDSNIH